MLVAQEGEGALLTSPAAKLQAKGKRIEAEDGKGPDQAKLRSCDVTAEKFAFYPEKLLEGFFFFFFLVFLGLHPWPMEAPRLGVKLELQLPAYATATATPDLSHVCNLHCSLW